MTDKQKQKRILKLADYVEGSKSSRSNSLSRSNDMKITLEGTPEEIAQASEALRKLAKFNPKPVSASAEATGHRQSNGDKPNGRPHWNARQAASQLRG
jgi:hypothetical protein